MTEGNREVRELPKGWSLVSISDVCLVMSGQTPKGVDSNISSDGEIPWFRVGNMNEPGNERALRFTDIRLTQERANSLGLHVRPENTIVFPKRGGAIATNKKRFLGQPSAYDLNLMGIFPVGFNIQYFWYWFQTVDLKRFSDGSNVPQINHGDIEPLLFPLAPLFEQSRIVEKVEELFSDIDYGIKSLKTAQKQLKVYRQAVLKWAFDGNLTEAWRTQQSTLKTGEALLAQIKAERENRYQQQLVEWKTAVEKWEAIGKVGKKPQKPQKYKDPSPIPKAQISGSPSIPESWFWANLEQLKEFSLYGPRFSSQDYVDDGIPIARTTDINSSGKVDLKYAPKISLSDQEFEKYKLIKGDLLLTRTGSIGTNAVFHASEKAIPGAFLIHYRLLPSLNIWFIFYFLESPKAQQHFFERSSGVGRPNLNVPSIEELMIPLPSLEEQEEIVQEIESRLSICDQLEATIIENLQKAEALRQSILKQAFEGKLVPQDPNDEPAEKLLERIRLERQEKQPQPAKQLKIKGT